MNLQQLPEYCDAGHGQNVPKAAVTGASERDGADVWIAEKADFKDILLTDQGDVCFLFTTGTSIGPPSNKGVVRPLQRRVRCDQLV